MDSGFLVTTFCFLGFFFDICFSFYCIREKEHEVGSKGSRDELGGKEFYKIYYMKLSEKKNTKWARLSQMNLSLFSSLTYINNSSFVDFVGKKKPTVYSGICDDLFFLSVFKHHKATLLM